MHLSMIIAGISAGAVTGLFGTGGGAVLLPLLAKSRTVQKEQQFAGTVAVILPLTAVSLLGQSLPWKESWPYLIGSAAGGILAAKSGSRIPAAWLHRIVGCLMVAGGIRKLC